MNHRTYPKTVLAACAGAALAVCVATSHAQESSGATEEMAARIYETLTLIPVSEPNRIWVEIEDGRYKVRGFADDNSVRNDARRRLAEIDGLDMDLVDNEIVYQ